MAYPRLLITLIISGCLGFRDLPPASVDTVGSEPVATDDDTAPTDTTPTEVEPTWDDALDLGEPIACPSPLASAQWREIGATMGLAGHPDFDPANAQIGGSLALDDFDGDGDLDLIYGFDAAALGVHNVYFQPDGGPDQAWVASSIPERTTGAGYALADLDGDGVRDLITVGPPQVFLLKDGAFVASPFPEIPEGMNDMNLRDLSPADYDGDGDIDLYAGMNGDGDATDPDAIGLRRDFLLNNDGSANLTLVADAVPLEAATGKAFDVAWFDFDLDGDQDAYVANDVGNITGPNALFENQDGVLVTASESCQCGVSTTGMGVDAADVNADGYPDLFVTAADAQLLLKTVDGPTYVDYSDLDAAYYPEMGWGAVFFDFDNDADQDLLAALGSITRTGQPTEPGDGIGLLSWTGERYEDQSVAHGLEQAGSYRTVVANDLNHDGVLDFVAGDVGLRPQVYLSEGCTAEGWLEVEAPPGSHVTVTAGGVTQTDQVTTESGRGGATEPFVHFGLGAKQTFSQLEVRLPDGTVLTAQGGIDARRRIKVIP